MDGVAGGVGRDEGEAVGLEGVAVAGVEVVVEEVGERVVDLQAAVGFWSVSGKGEREWRREAEGRGRDGGRQESSFSRSLMEHGAGGMMVLRRLWGGCRTTGCVLACMHPSSWGGRGVKQDGQGMCI